MEGEIRVLPNANHNRFLSKSGNEHEMDSVSQCSPEFFPLVTEWLERVVRSRPGSTTLAFCDGCRDR